ncbi:phage tail protein [Nocardioides pacificus]
MADPFVAEIRLFPFNFAPKGWAWCDGQVLPISQNTALFSLLGTTYGGDGKSNFALPDLRGRLAMHPGQGPGLSSYDLGETGGTETVALLNSEIPHHTHSVLASPESADLRVPGPARALGTSSGAAAYGPASGGLPAAMAPQTLGPAGGGLPHNNLMPYLTFYYCIALQGVFPPRP